MYETARHNRWQLMKAIFIALLVTGAFACSDVDADAQEGVAASRAVAGDRFTTTDLERSFWECDYAATKYGDALEDGTYCAKIYDDVKQRKFSGDFHAMLMWWEQNRLAQHAAVVQRWHATP